MSADRDFIHRHIGPNEQQQQQMLQELGFKTCDDMIDAVIPRSILDRNRIHTALEPGQSEAKVLKKLQDLAQKNKIYKTLIGQGYYGTHTPEVILRNILENPGWYTSYTPYQAEISQGRLEAIANFQTMIADITGLDIANASLLDEGTAAAEAMTLCYRTAKNKKSNRFFVSKHCHPQTIDVIQLRAQHLQIECIVEKEESGIPENIFGGIFQYPHTQGKIVNYTPFIQQLHAQGALAILATDLLALTILKTPADMNADIAIGSSQRFGVPFGFGGPHAGFIAVKDIYKRALPGRVIGVSVDKHDTPCYRMAMQTREQHIRREKATSNICTAQALLAIIAGFYGVYFGPQGLKRIAKRTHAYTQALANGLKNTPYSSVHSTFFDTLTIKTQEKTEFFLKEALAKGYNLRKFDSIHLSISFDETTTLEDVQAILSIFRQDNPNIETLANETSYILSDSMVRTTTFMLHPVFNTYHSETQLMRYMRSLMDKDLALDRTMIPLGSCTMKLNAAAEMKAVTFPGFSNIHPFVPKNQTQGYQELIEDLEILLCKITGYDAFSLQPNAGSQGEYAGLLCIKKYHTSLDQEYRDVCFIPISAHGTNPASAQLAGMKIITIQCDPQGNIDLVDLKNKCTQFEKTLSCIMITYPSTHGVFEEKICEICEMIHHYGGQVYIDGANMNAMVGLSYPGLYGGDVSHFNLHKTFCIPHGGGGPGVGPIGVKSHLATFLPGHSIVDNGRGPCDAVASAPWGSASILPITYAYILLMGAQGLKKATEIAILSANYIAKKLESHYAVLYKGATGYVGHECILDIRDIEKNSGITNEDIAKRLIDFGFHAPTMSFPVAGTLMIEPTESEPFEEIQRFIEALQRIHQEIQDVQQGRASRHDNVLIMAPHTAKEVTSSHWLHPYSREEAAYPQSNTGNKYWPPIARINNVYGDRNLFCSCIPIADSQEKTTMSRPQNNTI